MASESARVIRRLIDEHGYSHAPIAAYINMTESLIKEAERDYVEFIGATYERLLELEEFAIATRGNKAGINTQDVLNSGVAVFEHQDGQLYYQPLMLLLRSGRMTLQDTLRIFEAGRTLPLLHEVQEFYPGITELVEHKIV